MTSALPGGITQPVTGMNFNPHSKDVFRLANIDYQRQLEVSPADVAEMLLKATNLMSQIAFTYSIIDKPQEGQLYLISLPPNAEEIPSDGYHYLDNEVTFSSRLANGMELLCMERKQGFAPGDQVTSKVRRRYLFATGHNDLQLLHYSSLDESQRQMVNPVYTRQATPRRYPIQPMQANMNNMNPYVQSMAGISPMTMTPPMQSSMHTPIQSPLPRGPATNPIPIAANSYVQFQTRAGVINPRIGQGMPTQSSVKAGNRRTKGGKNKTTMISMADAAADEADEPSGDELDNLKFREVSMARFKRCHEYIAEIFSPYSISSIMPPESPYQSKNVEELKKQINETQAEIEKMTHEHSEKMKNFTFRTESLSKGMQEIKKCNNMEELFKIQEKIENESDFIIEPFDHVTLVQIHNAPDSETDENDQQEMMQDDDDELDELDEELYLNDILAE